MFSHFVTSYNIVCVNNCEFFVNNCYLWGGGWLLGNNDDSMNVTGPVLPVELCYKCF